MTPSAYYNEIDPYAAQWLRNLIAAGHIAPGDVDERSIEDVCPADLVGYTQCHFFAGIGVWSYALRRAGWSDDRPIWTGSCPCQPFSAAGEGAGFADERHLWPAFHHLVRERRPAVVAGEQVASGHADPWIDLVHTDLEALGYAFGALAFPSAGIGAPHIRDRLYWMGYADDAGLEGLGIGHQTAQRHRQGAVRPTAAPSEFGGLADPACGQHLTGRAWADLGGLPASHGGSQEHREPGPTNGFWRDADWLACRDAKWRAVEPGSFPLVDGASAAMGRLRADWHSPAGKEGAGHRVGRLRGYGNAINAEAAVAFIEAMMDSLGIDRLSRAADGSIS